MLKSTLKIVVLGGSLMLLSFLAGCGLLKGRKSHQQISYEEALEIKLSQKYNRKFKVDEVTQEDRMTWMDEIRYGGEVEDCESGKTYDAMITQDKNAIYDNYPKIIYQDAIEQRVDEICGRHVKIEIQKKEFLYTMSGETWESMNLMNDYIEKGFFEISMNISVSGKNAEDVAQTIYEFFDELNKYQFQYIIGCDIYVQDLKGHINFATIPGEERDTLDNILNKVRGGVENV